MKNRFILDRDVFGEDGAANLSPAQMLIGGLVTRTVGRRFLIGHVSPGILKLEVVCPERHHRRAQELADDIVEISGPKGDAVLMEQALSSLRGPRHKDAHKLDAVLDLARKSVFQEGSKFGPSVPPSLCARLEDAVRTAKAAANLSYCHGMPFDPERADLEIFRNFILRELREKFDEELEAARKDERDFSLVVSGLDGILAAIMKTPTPLDCAGAIRAAVDAVKIQRRLVGDSWATIQENLARQTVAAEEARKAALKAKEAPVAPEPIEARVKPIVLKVGSRFRVKNHEFMKDGICVVDSIDARIRDGKSMTTVDGHMEGHSASVFSFAFAELLKNGIEVLEESSAAPPSKPAPRLMIWSRFRASIFDPTVWSVESLQVDISTGVIHVEAMAVGGDGLGRKAKFTFAGASFPTGFEVLS